MRGPSRPLARIIAHPPAERATHNGGTGSAIHVSVRTSKSGESSRSCLRRPDPESGRSGIWCARRSADGVRLQYRRSFWIGAILERGLSGRIFGLLLPSEISRKLRQLDDVAPDEPGSVSEDADLRPDGAPAVRSRDRARIGSRVLLQRHSG